MLDELSSGGRRPLARLLTRIENGDPSLRPQLPELFAAGRGAHLVGITGPPGSGKSTLVSALIGEWRRRGRRVGVLAVDPSSPYTGGAILGDRIRMMDHAADRDVFVRSMASRGELGGLAAATWTAAAALVRTAPGAPPPEAHPRARGDARPGPGGGHLAAPGAGLRGRLRRGVVQ